MKVTMLLADAAEAINGKLYILGGGWTITGPAPSPSAIALYISVPWEEANRQHHMKLSLLTADDQPVRVPTPNGETALELSGQFEVGRPPGSVPGAAISVALALTIAPVPLPPAGRYVWRLFINDRTQEEWQLPFSTRAQDQVPRLRGRP